MGQEVTCPPTSTNLEGSPLGEREAFDGKPSHTSAEKGRGSGEGPEGKQIHLLGTETKGQGWSRAAETDPFKTLESSSDKNPTVRCYINGFSTLCR